MVRNGHSVILFPKWLLSNITYGTKWLETRQKKVRHQDSSEPVGKDSSAPRHFGTRLKRQFGTKTFRYR